MENTVQFIQTTPTQLAELINNGVKSQLDDLKKQLDLNTQEELLTRKETCDLLKIDSSTLWHWTNKGKVICYGIVNRRYYKRSEIMKSLTKLKIG
ncbi:helix-turn-helix domain-containing protein [Chryseobacterium sp.]|uniref:helix-turn-helix domain-containing protein n=1 Tax=Chryseobacterium sp. TaxID=1871047 RepID=UPI002FC7ED57